LIISKEYTVASNEEEEEINIIEFIKRQIALDESSIMSDYVGCTRGC